jgi:hypothetical protein
LKKRTKKLLIAKKGLRHEAALPYTRKSFLFLLFKKEILPSWPPPRGNGA